METEMPGEAVLALEPQLPYVYVPTPYYIAWTEALNAQYKSDFAEPVCNM